MSTTLQPQETSARFVAGSRHYFFDLKQSEHGPYLTITESKPDHGTFQRQRLLIEAEHIEKFLDAIRAVARPEIANSYSAWSQEEDDRLRSEVAAGKGIAEIAAEHKRAKGAIRSRLKHLEIERPVA